MNSDIKSMVEHLVAVAVQKEASDLILTYECPPVMKVMGKVVKVPEMPVLGDNELEAIVSHIVPENKAAILETSRQVDFAFAHGATRFRVNIFYQRNHLAVVMRYVQDRIRTLDELNMPDIVPEMIAHDNGLILMVGPTGSGKSTTLAAMIEHINQNFNKHIITIEDPIEYVFENKQSVIEQREIGLDALTFPDALRSSLREAPDVVMLGEMRDLDSVATAITVAETGHLVLSTIHASNAVGTIDRIIDIFPAGYKEQIRIQLADILVGVLNQRLVPRTDGTFMPIVEIMVANSAVKNAIRTSNSAQLPTIIQTASSEGMHLLDDLLVKAALRDEITKETALDYAQDRNQVRKAMSLS